jgi:hypothetical protein
MKLILIALGSLLAATTISIQRPSLAARRPSLSNATASAANLSRWSARFDPMCEAASKPGQGRKVANSGMGPISQYLLPTDKEISLARSAAPKSVSDAAAVLVLTESGFQPAVKGNNGFVCMVARSWSAGFDDPDFWNPRLLAPICYNALAAPSQVAETIKRTKIAFAGGSATDILKTITAGIESGELPTAQQGAMGYMLSRQTYFNNREGHWLPHLMFFSSDLDPMAWGAGLPGSPIMAVKRPEARSTVFLIPVARWSDGTPAPSEHH